MKRPVITSDFGVRLIDVQVIVSIQQRIARRSNYVCLLVCVFRTMSHTHFVHCN